MSIVGFIRRCLDKGMPLEKVLIAAEIFETEFIPRLAPLARKAPEMERVWVYVIGVDHPDETLVKVGISQHPNHRLATLEKERGYNLYIAHTEGPYPRNRATTIERLAHQLLADEREQGEWFLCGVERAIATVRSCASGVTA